MHRALAEATDPETDPDRRAWHRATCTPGPSEEVAAELERSAGRAQARGGLAAAAAFLQRAVALTDDPARRGERALAAAQASLQAGAFDAALALLATAEAGPLDEFQRARVDLVRAHVAFASGFGSDAPPLLMMAARGLEPFDLDLARETYLAAWGAAEMAGSARGPGILLEICHAVQALPPPTGDPRPLDLLLDGLALLITDGHAAAAPILQRAANALTGISLDDVLRWGWMATFASTLVWDIESFHAISARHVQLVRDAGAVAQLPLHLWQLALLQHVDRRLRRGRVAGGGERQRRGGDRQPHRAVHVVAAPGAAREGSRVLGCAGERDRARRRPRGRGSRRAGTGVQPCCATASDATRRRLPRPRKPRRTPSPGGRRCGRCPSSSRRPRAAETRSSPATRSSGSIETTQAVRHRLRARHRSALPRVAERRCGRRRALSRGDRPARAVPGSVRISPAPTCSTASGCAARVGASTHASSCGPPTTCSSAIGMEAFAERARRELIATGEKVRKRSDESRHQLTPQEEQIARLARDGLSNPEIGAQLFISARTVEWHLRKVFTKLDISSRRQLRAALPTDEPRRSPARRPRRSAAHGPGTPGTGPGGSTGALVRLGGSRCVCHANTHAEPVRAL